LASEGGNGDEKVTFEEFLEYYNHHRNLFGTDENTPFTKGKQGGQSWQSTSKTSLGPNEIFNGNAAGAG